MKEFFEGLLNRLSQWYTIVGLVLMALALALLLFAPKLSAIFIKNSGEDGEDASGAGEGTGENELAAAQATDEEPSGDEQHEEVPTDEQPSNDEQRAVKSDEDAGMKKAPTAKERRENTKLMLQVSALVLAVLGFLFAMII